MLYLSTKIRETNPTLKISAAKRQLNNQENISANIENTIVYISWTRPGWYFEPSRLERFHCNRMRLDINSNGLCKVLSALALILFFASPAAASAQGEPYRVLVIHSFRSSLPVNTAWYDGIVRGFTSASDLRIEIDIETPDLTRFNDRDYVRSLLSLYRQKYRGQELDLIIPTYTPAFKFLLDHGEEVFPDVPIVFCGADRRFVGAQETAPHITGITSHRDIAGTLELALHVHPATRRIAVIMGSGGIGRQFEREAREASRRFARKVEFNWLRGKTLAELTEVVHDLSPDTVILYLAQLQDRFGKTHIPIRTLRELSGVANAPIYGLWDTLIGHGIIGGRLATLEADGFQASQMALRILGGEAPTVIPVIDREENVAIFDGRELARWNIDEDRLPAGSRILHSQLSVWGEHKTEIVTAGLVSVIQGLWILALILNRARLRRTQIALQTESERRGQAENVALGLRVKFAKFSKQRSLGAIATTIAHEVNQPLIAIQNYAQAANRRVQSRVDQVPKLMELLKKIDQQAGRAGDVIQHIRTLVSTDDTELRPVSLCSVLEQVIQIMEPEIESHGCSIDYGPVADLPEVLADALAIQLVLVNLLQNAMREMKSIEQDADKVISIELSQTNDQEVQVSLADRGPGIPPDSVEDIFEPLYSGGTDGLGMGLAICKTILGTHEGRIWYTPNPSGGAIFCFTLRVAAV